ncbi:uncharacterized protein EV154DRAFT_461451 [Mucor mucedo]|uniref:uncharacterized protein n=1 Tax=Mucor mucedo TaxID=29922 RepID=UPI00221FD2EC|nr:uncharacterized protein EV154DRAFT_461451 [Mucor mucedo]KAI7893162.1 hypothetical protein EV154DRAFT_461451 [Mucor mucedo]
MSLQEEEEADSDYSLDYEFLGPRTPVYRNDQDADSDASELSCSSSCHEGFDMWDEDPYSTNDFTWESNDMRLTGFIKERQKELNKINTIAPWNNSTFWKKEKGWPKQLPSSSSTTNHDQSANALSLVLSDYGLSESLHAVYRDRIVECGKFNKNCHTNDIKINNTNLKNITTWLDTSSDTTNDTINETSTKFIETHASVPLEKQSTPIQHCSHKALPSSTSNNNFLSKFTPFTKYIKRSQFPATFPQDAYLSLGFEPLCLAEKYGYMAIGGHLVCVGDDAYVFHLAVSFNEHENRLEFGSPQKIRIPLTVTTFSSQYVSWSKSSLFFAHTSDTHNTVFIWKTQPKFEMLYRIDAGGYTYAIQFHPQQEGVLTFSNRYGYIHTVNLDEVITRADPKKTISIFDYNQDPQIFARHEITMVSFRGEKDRKLRILAKINGLQWSKDGSYLYVSTKKRVLAYEFIQSSRQIRSLEKMAGLEALSILQEQQKKKRKNQDMESSEGKKKRKLWSRKWNNIPAHVRYNMLGNTNLASHW